MLLSREDALKLVTWRQIHSLLCRLLVLRRAGRVGIILAEYEQFYIADVELQDVWKTKRHITVPVMEKLVIALESNLSLTWQDALDGVQRKGVQSDDNPDRRKECTVPLWFGT